MVRRGSWSRVSELSDECFVVATGPQSCRANICVEGRSRGSTEGQRDAFLLLVRGLQLGNCLQTQPYGSRFLPRDSGSEFRGRRGTTLVLCHDRGWSSRGDGVGAVGFEALRLVRTPTPTGNSQSDR